MNLTTLLVLGLGSYGLYRMTRRYSGVIFPIERPRVTLEFGVSAWPYSAANPHRGVDLAPFAGSAGAPIRAPIAGTVIYARNTDPYAAGDERATYGRFCVISCSLPYDVWASDLSGVVHTLKAGESFYLVFAHFDRLDVIKGQQVSTGQLLGTLGASGKAYGAHLHLELRRGAYGDRQVLDPMDLFFASIVGLKDSVEVAA